MIKIKDVPYEQALSHDAIVKLLSDIENKKTRVFFNGKEVVLIDKFKFDKLENKIEIWNAGVYTTDYYKKKIMEEK